MRAATEFLAEKNIAKIEGWFASGGSKRGWTTWTVGAVKCDTCPKIIGIAPLVPIVPDLTAEVHRMWRSYNAFTFAFADYKDTDFFKSIDDPIWQSAMQVIDPIHHLE